MSRTDSEPVRILHLEDVDSDSELVFASLASYGIHIEPIHARDQGEFRAALQRGGFDAILSDFTLPDFDGLSALQLSIELQPEVPFIFVSGTIGEDRAVAGVKAGAADYVLKHHLDRLGPSLQRAIREAEQRRTQKATEAALTEVQDRMRFALEAARVGIWDWEVGSGRVTWSEVNEELHGMAVGTFRGTLAAVLQSIHDNDRARVESAFNAVTPADPRFRVDYQVPWPDGSMHWISSVGRIFFDTEQRPVRGIGVNLDMTVQKRLEEGLRQAQRLESIGGLAAGVAHDFNNLLTIINGYCGMLAERLADDRKAVADLEEIQRAGDSAAALTRQLLAFSRKQILTPQTVDLNTVIGDTQRMVRRLVEENVRIDVRCAQERLWVRVDPGQIEQVILNLVVNARDAMPDGGTITIETELTSLDDDRVYVQADPGPYVRLTVSDTGTGISPEVQSRLFEPFFTTKEQGRGTGLGLATVYGIVKQSGGHIWVYSELGMGTTFKLYFPVAGDIGSAAAATTKREATQTGAERILVVEDQPALRELVARMLTGAGHQVLLASSAEEAQRICLIDQGPIDIVLTDVIMPGASGRSLAMWIKEHRPESKLLYMSGYSEHAIAHHGVLEPGTTLLQKPFTRSALFEKLREVIAKPADGASA